MRGAYLEVGKAWLSLRGRLPAALERNGSVHFCFSHLQYCLVNRPGLLRGRSLHTRLNFGASQEILQKKETIDRQGFLSGRVIHSRLNVGPSQEIQTGEETHHRQKLLVGRALHSRPNFGIQEANRELYAAKVRFF